MQHEPPLITDLAYNEPHRPQYHFTAPRGWLNDPNGLVYFEGEYHLFYQHFPDDTIWGPMHWGHAVTRDLVNWVHLPPALFPDELGYIFSGSAVIDWQNSAGFDRGAMVAVFTHHNPQTARQSQSLAYSSDRGRTWHKHAENPVLSPPDAVRDFRDPKVFWYEQENGRGHWVMALATTASVLFFTSPDLRQWTASGSFGNRGATGGVWECPDLFELPLPGGAESRWVLIVGVGDGAPAGGSGEQYFIGRFDGRTFRSEQTDPLWFDYGADCYATQTWNNAPHGRRLAISWMSNWRYGGALPTDPWRGSMSLPRELSLAQTVQGLRVAQRPLPELRTLRTSAEQYGGFVVNAGQTAAFPVTGSTVELMLAAQEFGDAGELHLRLCYEAGEQITIGCEAAKEILYCDRRFAGNVDFDPAFAARHEAPLHLDNGRVQLHLFLDQASIEIFAAAGTVSMTESLFPQSNLSRIELSTGAVPVTVTELTVYALQAATFRQGTQSSS